MPAASPTPVCQIEVPRYLRDRLNRYVASVAQDAFEAGMAAADRQVRDLAAKQRARDLAAEQEIGRIQRIVAERFGVTITDLKSDRQTAAVSRPRQVAMYLAACLTRHSMPVIGRYFRRDHSTVCHGIRRVRERCVHDGVLRATIAELSAQLSGGV